MNKIIFCLLVLTLSGNFLVSQNKKELIREVNDLNSKLTTTEQALAESRQKEKISTAQAESYAIQVKELQETNASLMGNLNSFTETSSTKLDALTDVMNSLRKKEAELKFINDALTSNDSISFIVLNNFKKTLGENVKMAFEGGSVKVIMEHSALFHSGSANSDIKEEAKEMLGKMAAVLKANPDMRLSIESHASETVPWANVYQEATSVANVLTEDHAIKPERIITTRKTDPSNTYHIKLHPNFDSFYLQVHENMRN